MSNTIFRLKQVKLLDFRAKRQIEIEAILGNSLRFAKEKNLDLPLIDEFYHQLLSY